MQRGIVLDVERGAVNAWIFMKERGVSESVMLRVLAHPNRRRTSDAFALKQAGSDGLPLRQR
ncbi:hypothetical protein [Massilia suwonensis]|uniref:Uncharacterized protein n=1 Tax=Massilia suwonensis TaxID=648895 RepID=A0ABW0MLJ1_9BURK